MFLSAHRALLKGTVPRESAAWLATIARNECWARIKNRMREPLPTADIDHEASTADPLAEAIRNADLAAMWAAVAALPLQQRDALLLREFGGLSYDELADALSVSGPAVESLLFRARQGVRTRVQAAYAGITGGAWLDALARLAGGLGGGMAPVAAKVAVVGVGAAVATGGAVVAPRILQHSGAGVRPSHRHAMTTARSLPAARQPTARILVARTTKAVALRAAVPTRPATTTGERSDDGAPATGGRSSDDSERAATSEHRERVRSGSGDLGGGSDRPAATSESSDGGTASEGGDSASGGGHGSDGGGSDGDATTTPSPVVTVSVPTGAVPPIPVPDEHG